MDPWRRGMVRELETRVEARVWGVARRDRSIIGVGLILLLAFALRWSHLGARNLWFDEAWSWYVSRQPVSVILEEGRSNIHPPFLHIVLKVWTALFGESRVALRMPSLLANVGTIGLTYVLGRWMLSRRVALLAAFFLALSPHQVFYAQEARMYALVTVLTVGAVLAHVRLLREMGMLAGAVARASSGRRLLGWAFIYMLSGALALYTHVFGALVLTALAVHFLGLVAWRSHQGDLPAPPRLLLRRWALWQLGLGLLYAPWVTTFIYQVSSRPRQGWRPPLEALTFVGECFLFLGKMSVGAFVYPQGVYYALKNLFEYRWTGEMLLRAWENLSLYPLAIGTGAFLLWRGGRAVGGVNLLSVLFFLPVILIGGILLVIRQYMDFGRYLTMITPYYFLLLAAGVMTIRGWGKRGVAIGLVSLPMVLGLKAHYRASSFDSDYRPVAAVLLREWQRGDGILVDPAYLDRCLRYELRETPLSQALPPADSPGVPLHDRLRGIRSARVWVVLDYRSPDFRRFAASERDGAWGEWGVEWDRRFPEFDSRVRLLRLRRRT
jgi:4-amino-4-deoxy-L-arabinose transferase-like glycosyltransferase